MSIYERLHFIRGLTKMWMDIYDEPEKLGRLIDILVEQNLVAIKHFAALGADGMISCDDWGLQNQLMIAPHTWRELWKPRYARVYKAAHDAGLFTFLHSCGYIVDILDDLIGIGLDAVHMDQQENMGLELLGSRFGGRITFFAPIVARWSVCWAGRRAVSSRAGTPILPAQDINTRRSLRCARSLCGYQHGDNTGVQNELDHAIYVPPGGPPRVASPSREIYQLMGEDKIFSMLEDFYRALEASAIRGMFPPDMVASSRKSAAFFVGLLGGPPLYQQRYGSPMLRARHLPFPIDEAARQVWLAVFNQVLDDAPAKYGFPPQHLEGFRTFLREFSGWMVNKA